MAKCEHKQPGVFLGYCLYGPEQFQQLLVAFFVIQLCRPHPGTLNPKPYARVRATSHFLVDYYYRFLDWAFA